ncbi:4875_t:CDS:2 [Cetraspora pellucida]|uniref:4875_t:CDS:1 n=1 Tax=Cetraspora pellucida TaxID=1433469 RepID=A0A9N9I8K1_9GLOM|nr:4875_t:CDS:2 [Cetraspora pellucida]
MAALPEKPSGTFISLQKVIAKKGARQVHQVSYSSSHEHISVCPTISAAGTYIPPLLIFKGKRMIPGLLNSAPTGFVMGFTETGYMRESLFQKYIEYFVSSIPPIHPHDILLYALPLYTTHILQPAELPFATLKKAYDKESYMPTAICNAFKTTGIWPLNPSAIGPDRLDPSLHTNILQLAPTYTRLTKANPTKKELLSEIRLLNKRVERLEEELETLNNPESLKQLKEAEEEAERMVNEKQHKKEVAIQK